MDDLRRAGMQIQNLFFSFLVIYISYRLVMNEMKNVRIYF